MPSWTPPPRRWNLRQFSSPHLPSAVGALRELGYFGDANGLRVLDLPIKMPGTGIRLPRSLVQIEELVSIALRAELMLRDVDDLYVYVTLDQKVVPPRGTQRRPGWHSDGFLLGYRGEQVDVVAENAVHINRAAGRFVDHTYIAYDRLPTLFHPGPWHLAGAVEELDCADALDRFADVVARSPELIVSWAPGTVLRLDPYDVHAAAPNPLPQPMGRTFCKVIFSTERFNREGNTHNGLFDYDWPMIPRNPDRREHPHL